MQPTELSAFEQHILPPARHPDLAALPTLEQTTCLIPSSSHHVPPFTEWLPFPSGALPHPPRRASRTIPPRVASSLRPPVTKTSTGGAVERHGAGNRAQ